VVSAANVHHVHEEKGVAALKIGRFVISRIRKTPAGLTIYPWQALTEDRVSPELRAVVAKVARSEAKSYLAEQGFPVCTGPHECRGSMLSFCRESCSGCMGNDARACFASHDQSLREGA
jgi:hypothetical protein